jgi:aminoglycoside phosphotransferase (APT) family kinase protein
MRPETDTIDVRPGEGVDEDALRRWLAATVPELVPAGARVSVRQFPAGFSNLTYLVSIAGEDGTRAYVLRRPPRGVKPGIAHDMGREHSILAALHPLGVPVPRPIVRCDDASVIGAPFYLMEFVDGVILRGPTPSDVRVDTGASIDVQRALSETFVATLNQLHAVDVRRGPLAALGKPDGYVQRQVDGWTRRWHASRTEDVPDVETVAKWLAAHIPHSQDAVLLHNDFKYDNLVLDCGTMRQVVAILDWEMATIGDPLMDLGTSLAYWVEAADAPIFRSLGLGVTALPGSYTRAELVRAYAEASGRDVTNAPYYYVFGLFKVAVIAQQIYARHTQGLTSDARFAALGAVVSALGTQAERVTRTGRI